MRGFYDFDPSYFIEVLEAFPGGLATVRASLLRDFGILVGNCPAHEIWNLIERDRGEEGAADVVSELVISKGGERVNQLIARSVAGEDLGLRANDSKLARLLFEEEDWVEPEIGGYVVNYFERSRPFLVDDEYEGESLSPDTTPSSSEPEFEEDDDEDFDEEPDFLALYSGKARSSAVDDSNWSLERVQTPRRDFLTAPSGWKEADLEQFLWLNWEKIDLGLDRPLHLVGRQASLSSHTSDRVDLLARGSFGEWVAIELKIVEAKRGDLTQLLSYMADLERRGEAKAKVRGVLIAPDFAAKVLNAAAADPRVTLLRFYVGE